MEPASAQPRAPTSTQWPEIVVEAVSRTPASAKLRRPGSTKRWLRRLELFGAFTLGVAVLSFTYAKPGVAAGDIGVPGFDSFYHVKMAVLLPQIGLVKTFPWLQFVYFSPEGSFVSHHYGFHVLLVPFVHLAHFLGYDYLTGGRWAESAFFGLVALGLDALLIQGRVRSRWLWLLLFLVLPPHFFLRHSYVRAISPSLFCMLLMLYTIFAHRPIWAAVVIVAYTHLYLGSVAYSPLIVGAYAAASLLGPREERSFPWSMVLWTMLGWLVGLRTHPYYSGAIAFLRMQIFGTGLNPDISVGGEWYSYDDVWGFASGMCGPLFAAWTAALIFRVRGGGHFTVRETTLLILNFLFLALTLKAKRFIEYWPAFGLLSAAQMAAPTLNAAAAKLDVKQVRGALPSALRLMLPATIGLALIVALARLRPAWLMPFLIGWKFWALPVIALFAVALLHGWRQSKSLAPVSPNRRRLGLSVAALWAVVTIAAVLLGPAGALVARQREISCTFNLPAVRGAMQYLQSVSEPGDIVFTDDWDVFPLYFYHNHHNHYIVGLDPKFTQGERPDLWERFVRITRGEVPRRRPVPIELGDIRKYFKARFVVTDSDHKALAAKLAAAPEFAELIYPSQSYKQSQDAPYHIFRIRQQDMPRAPAHVEDDGRTHLDDLTPVVAEQAWGSLQIDASVEGERLHVGAEFSDRGLGTHAASKLVYAVPPGFDVFIARAGVHHHRQRRGSAIISVDVDDREVFRSELLHGGDPPVDVYIPVATAKRIALKADPTADGNHFDHIDWLDPCFEKEAAAAPSQP